VTGPNGQAGHRVLVEQWRDASRRLRVAATVANDIAEEVLSTGPRPGHAQAVYDVADDLRRLSTELALIERQQENREQTEGT